jgi:hypothetical protein
MPKPQTTQDEVGGGFFVVVQDSEVEVEIEEEPNSSPMAVFGAGALAHEC